ncbi:a disintegrin and metalloproteinase with thrombospondin motifs 7 [Sarotherodon galilaeus]
MCTMMNVITALALSCFSIKHLVVSTVSGWIAVSGSEFQTSEVQAGENVTLQCTKISRYEVMTFWFRLINGTTVNSIAVKPVSIDVKSNAEFQTGKFQMTQNTSDVFLKIKQVDVSDSGLYFCGFVSEGRLNLRVMQLKVGDTDEPQDDMDCIYVILRQAHEVAKLTNVTLGVLSVFLLMVITGLAVQHGKSAKEHENKNPEQFENLDPGTLKDPALQSAVKRRGRPAAQKQPETHVIYTTNR